MSMKLIMPFFSPKAWLRMLVIVEKVLLVLAIATGFVLLLALTMDLDLAVLATVLLVLATV
jgi:hypothetical protein